jgi:hypothetical protein
LSHQVSNALQHLSRRRGFDLNLQIDRSGAVLPRRNHLDRISGDAQLFYQLIQALLLGGNDSRGTHALSSLFLDGGGGASKTGWFLDASWRRRVAKKFGS